MCPSGEGASENVSKTKVLLLVLMQYAFFLQAEERLRMLDEKRKLEEQVNSLQRDLKRVQKAHQDTILNKSGGRPRFSMSLTPKK